MESGERMRLQAIISVLVKQLGGKATITEAEINQATEISVNVKPDGLDIQVEVKNG